jgi:hypothetical protein
MRHHVIVPHVGGSGWSYTDRADSDVDASAAIGRLVEKDGERGLASLARASKLAVIPWSNVDRVPIGAGPTRTGDGIPRGRTSTVQRSYEHRSSDGPRRSWRAVSAVRSATGRHTC